MGEVLKKGKLSSGKLIDIMVSDKSSVSKGLHIIANVLGPDGALLDHDALAKEEKAEAFIFLTDYLQERHPDGKWRLMLNGPGLTSRLTFHLHGILPEASDQILRLIFNPGAFLSKLEIAESLDGLEPLIKELEGNLK